MVNVCKCIGIGFLSCEGKPCRALCLLSTDGYVGISIRQCFGGRGTSRHPLKNIESPNKLSAMGFGWCATLNHSISAGETINSSYRGYNPSYPFIRPDIEDIIITPSPGISRVSKPRPTVTHISPMNGTARGGTSCWHGFWTCVFCFFWDHGVKALM